MYLELTVSRKNMEPYPAMLNMDHFYEISAGMNRGTCLRQPGIVLHVLESYIDVKTRMRGNVHIVKLSSEELDLEAPD